MKSSLCILLSIFQDEKSVQDKEIFEIKAEHTLRSFFHVFFELQGIDTVVKYILFVLFCVKTKLNLL